MRVTRKTHWYIRLQNLLFILLFLTAIGLIAVLSMRYNYQADWTASGRNTLSKASQVLLKQLEGQITVISFAQDPNTKEKITKLINRYQHYKPDLKLEFINPETDPDKVRELGVRFQTELVIKKDGRQEKLQDLSEKDLTNAFNRVARSENAWVIFLEGHGERDPRGNANFALENFTKQLETKGFHIQTLNLSAQSQIPNNHNQVLIIASPQTNFLPGEVDLIRDYIKNGGHLLWLIDPGSLHNLETLAEDLSIKVLPGVIIDPSAQILLGRGNATFALVPKYGNHPITDSLTSITLFPQSAALEVIKGSQWQSVPILTTLSRSWVETSELGKKIEYDKEQDILGPLTIGLALNRERSLLEKEVADKDKSNHQGNNRSKNNDQQRVVIIGDGDFISNSHLGNGSNLDLGLSLINWLTHEDRLITVPARIRPDTTLQLSPAASSAIGIIFLFILPAALLGAGILIWWRRRQR
ncbi:ABC transporter [Candidatus Nitrosoglobus terrae]|uniref:ABC transporter n=1 Tax=Candidatus Nitrosoglobus terrae TaxID=1630141 RepID=A0A1Q2SLC3_9GAMM|nr:Gldg family protein [Candidatus Nitrosoglobus terrae]BAW79918.1 ABC transporter [Candidatus Nitrosoglobus terrae]